MNLEPKKPTVGNWKYAGKCMGGDVWDNPVTGARAISSVDLTDHEGVTAHEWHISITGPLGRPSMELARAALADFGAVGFEEDNHVQSKARHFWLQIEKHLREPCPCKVAEAPIVEGDYTWREPRDEVRP